MGSAAISDATLGLFLCLPLGSVMCDAPPAADCRGAGTTIPFGLVFSNYPEWLPVVGAIVGALLGWLIVAAAQRLARAVH